MFQSQRVIVENGSRAAMQGVKMLPSVPGVAFHFVARQTLSCQVFYRRFVTFDTEEWNVDFSVQHKRVGVRGNRVFVRITTTHGDFRTIDADDFIVSSEGVFQRRKYFDVSLKGFFFWVTFRSTFNQQALRPKKLFIQQSMC